MASPTNMQVVDHEVLGKVKQLALARARVNAQDLPKVAWVLLRNAARQAVPGDGVAHPDPPPGGEEKARIRFRAPRIEYAEVAHAIRSSGRTISSLLEEVLERYGRTGQID